MAHPTISEIIERRLISGDPEIVPTADEPVRAVDVLGPFAAVYRFSVGRNRSWFEDCSIALRTGRGSWRETTSGSARGEGRDVPWRPSSRIFDGRSVCVFGSAGIDLPDEEERMVLVRGIYGFCEPTVRALRVSSGGRERIVDITSPVGAFVVVVTGEGFVMVQGSISRVGMWGSRSSQSCSGGADDLRSAVRAPPSHPSLKSVRQLNRRVLHTGSPPSPQPHLRRRTREWCRALAGRGPVGRPGVAISGRSPHFWTEKYPGRTLRSKSCRICRKSTRPQARELDALSIQAVSAAGRADHAKLGRPAA